MSVDVVHSKIEMEMRSVALWGYAALPTPSLSASCLLSRRTHINHEECYRNPANALYPSYLQL